MVIVHLTRWLSLLPLALVAGGVLAPLAKAAVPFQRITSPGPLASIAVGNDLSCQVTATGNPQPSFEPIGAEPGDCATYVLATNLTSEQTTLFGPAGPVLLPIPDAGYGVDNSLGASGQQRVVDGDVTSVETRVLLGATGLTATQFDVYRAGDEQYTSALQLRNTSPADSYRVTVYRVFLCYLQGGSAGDFGSYERFQNAYERPGCTTGPGVSQVRTESLTGITDPANWVVAQYTDAGTLLRAGRLPNTCLCGQDADLLVGVSWSGEFGPGVTADPLYWETRSSGAPVAAAPPTTAPPSTTPTTTPTPTAEPTTTPRATRSANASTESGTVFVRKPGGRLVKLDGTESIPVGSIVDARRGTVRLVAAASGKRKTMAGSFAGGIFKFTQTRKTVRGKRRLKTNLSLRGGNFAACKTRAAPDAGSARRREVRYLAAKAAGQFTVIGKYSSGVERGTTWKTSDGCDGTLTTVSKGTVAVTDRVRKKTVLVRAGRSYLARARRG